MVCNRFQPVEVFKPSDEIYSNRKELVKVSENNEKETVNVTNQK